MITTSKVPDLNSIEAAWLSQQIEEASEIRMVSFRTVRHPVGSFATLLTATKSRQVLVENISSGGAAVRSWRRFTIGETIILRRNAITVLGTVCWSLKRRHGISFQARLQSDALEAFALQRPEHDQRGSLSQRFIRRFSQAG